MSGRRTDLTYLGYMTENGAAIRRAGDAWATDYDEAGFRSGSFSTSISHAVDAQFLRMGTGVIAAMADPLGTAEAVHGGFYDSLQQSEQYYREGGGGLNGTLLQVAYLSGVHQLPEGIAGIDILTAESLSGDERFDRTVNGVVAVIGVADAVASPYAAGAAWSQTAATASRLSVAERYGSSLGDAIQHNLGFAPGYFVPTTKRMLRQFKNSLRKLGIDVKWTESGDSFFHRHSLTVHLNRETATLGTLVDEYSHAWNLVNGKGRYLPESLAKKHQSMWDYVKQFGTKSLSKPLETLYHQLELANLLKSGKKLPRFMRQMPHEDLKTFFDIQPFPEYRIDL